MKLCTKNYKNPPIFVKVTAKNQWHLFSGHGVYIAPWRPKTLRAWKTELNQARSKPETVNRPVRTARTFVHHYNSTQFCNTETVFSIFPSSRPTSPLRCGKVEVRGWQYGLQIVILLKPPRNHKTQVFWPLGVTRAHYFSIAVALQTVYSPLPVTATTATFLSHADTANLHGRKAVSHGHEAITPSC